ncbi:MAG: metallophosphatase, partial [Rikenellaceae bacterium]
MKLYRNFIIILSITFISCSAKMDFGDNSEDIKRKADLVIISTCDIHAAIDQIPKLATLVNRKRQENKNVLLVDAGDQWTGNAHVDYAKMPGKPMIELMNHLSYDAATLGNHSFDYGQRALNDNIKYAKFKIICANISGNNILEEPEPYTFIKIADWKIALLGLLNVDKTTHRTTACVSKLNNLGFEDPVVLAKQFKSLGAKADMFITLSHCGEETDSIICSKVPEMNLIIGGHSHTANKEQKEFYGVVVTHAGSRLEYAGVTEVWFNKKGGI